MISVRKGLEWNSENLLKVNRKMASFEFEDEINSSELRKVVEPWLSAIFQSEHLSLLVGAGLTMAVTHLAGCSAPGMGRIIFKEEYRDRITEWANASAKAMGRGEANFEDDLRTALELLKGLKIAKDEHVSELQDEIDTKLGEFIESVLQSEKNFIEKFNQFITTELLETKLKLKKSQANKLHTELQQKGFIDDNFKVTKNFKPFDSGFSLELNSDFIALEKSIISLLKNADIALNYLKSFLISFSSRTATRDRLNIFTTNYDRFIEYGCDMAGIITIDRFIGKIKPVFRTTKLELDYHYNPPGIRGEPRYVEGVARLTKLHGSIDWRFENNQIVKVPLGFGAEYSSLDDSQKSSDHLVIYPNSAKDIETAFYPYAELFRDLSYAICRPNSVLVTYGYSFGDSHINRILEDMLSIPSTHIVIIAYDDYTGRIRRFYERNNPAQFTLLIGNHFGDLKTLVDHYLPKAAIDRITIKSQQLKEKRGDKPSSSPKIEAERAEEIEE